MNILLVDDEYFALKNLEKAIHTVLPHAVLHSFQKSREVLEYASHELIDIAFLDIELPVLNGIDLALHLQKLYPKINIIFCTGYSEYALDAHKTYCSGYLLKPVTAENVQITLEHLRYPISENSSPVSIQCFGNFEVFYNKEPIHFKYSRTKELFAFLVDRNGAECSSAWLSAILFGDETHTSYLKQLRKDLMDTFEELGCPEVVRSNKGTLSINKNAVQCDYYDYLEGKRAKLTDEYMEQYSFY